MAVALIHPDDDAQAQHYHHAAVATGGKHVFLAGQVGRDEDWNLVADDLAGQVAQIYRNVAKHLEAAGASFQDVVRMTWYAVDWKPDMIDAFDAGVAQAQRELEITKPPMSLIGVDILFEPGNLIEAEVTAIVD